MNNNTKQKSRGEYYFNVDGFEGDVGQPLNKLLSQIAEYLTEDGDFNHEVTTVIQCFADDRDDVELTGTRLKTIQRRFERIIDECRAEAMDDARHGSYADQVRSSYYGGVL